MQSLLYQNSATKSQSQKIMFALHTTFCVAASNKTIWAVGLFAFCNFFTTELNFLGIKNVLSDDRQCFFLLRI